MVISTEIQKHAQGLIISFLLTIFCIPCFVRAAEQPDWWKAQKDVEDALANQKSNIADLVKRAGWVEPQTAQDAMFKLNILMRAGMNNEAIQTIKELKELAPNLDNSQISSIYYQACDYLSAWNIAQAVVETFAENISELGLNNRLIRYFLESGQDFKDVDRWLANLPKGKDSFFIKERLYFNVQHGQGDELIQNLTNDIKNNPQKIEQVTAFLDALIYSRQTAEEHWDLSWLPDTIKPQFATEAENMASRLKTLNKWIEAIVYYQRAMEIPLTEEEVKKLGMMRQVLISEPTLRAMFAIYTREGMADCLLKLQRNDEAQRWMLEAADIRKKNNFGRNALFAGQVQEASGERVVEKRIKKEEEKSKMDPQYWGERAQYYRGRNEPAQEEEALLKGLELTTPQPESEPVLMEQIDWRSGMLSDYVYFLKRQKREDEAITILKKEIQQFPSNMPSTKRAARILAFDFENSLRTEDEVLWQWLANQPTWEYTEERLLWRMLENEKQESLDKHLLRAEELAKEDPSRAHTLGWIMNRMQFVKRSIPLLKFAVNNTDNNELKERAVFTLFESYLDSADWQQAEQIFPEARKRLTPEEVPDWYGRIAVIAAKAGAKEDALRLWKEIANINPSMTDKLRDLTKAGLKDDLVKFYTEMQKQMPTSEIPGKVLIILNSE
jgi:tetratricopeptide (TPR) repeat protein